MTEQLARTGARWDSCLVLHRIRLRTLLFENLGLPIQKQSKGEHALENIPLTNKAWFWFTLGFSFVFLVVALAWPMPFFDGQIVRRPMLWQYYLLEIQSALKSSGNLGPASGDAFVAVGVSTIHTAIAAAAGFVSALLAQVRYSVER